MNRLFWVILLVFSVASLRAQELAVGYVFDDSNKNGKKERREKGLPNVAVSNGKEVVLTDHTGRYQLPVGNDNILFVIKPAGYEFPLNEFNQPRSFYIHKPLGSPEAFYTGVSATGKLPKSVDFALQKSDDSSAFSVLLFGDPQAYTEEEIDYFSKGVVDEVKGITGFSFGITLGDLVGDKLTLHQPYKEAIKQIGLPWFNVMGNHDMNYDAKSDSLSDETFEANFGPASYAFNQGKAHFIVLDDILYPDPRDGKGYWGGLREDQLAFLENDLKFVPKDHLIVLSMHIPLYEEKNKEAFRETDRQTIFRLLADFPNVLVLSAHTHYQVNSYIGKGEGLDRSKSIHEYNVGTTSGDWYSGYLNEKNIPVSTMRDGTPKGYAFLHIKDNNYVIDYKVAGKPNDYQIALYHPKVVSAKKAGSGAIYANFFMGAKNDTVEFRIDQGNWRPMKRVEEFDPRYYAEMQSWDFLDEIVPGRRPSNPVLCQHLWKTPIPANLPVGEHQIEVRATDVYGRTFTSSSTYRIQEVKNE